MASLDKQVKANDLMIFMGSGSTYQPIAFSKNATLNLKNAPIDQKSKDSANWGEYAYGDFDWTASTDALVNYVSTGTTQSTDEITNLFLSQQTVAVKFAVRTGTSPNYTADASKKLFTGKAIITDLSINANMGEMASYSISLQGTGALTFA